MKRDELELENCERVQCVFRVDAGTRGRCQRRIPATLATPAPGEMNRRNVRVATQAARVRWRRTRMAGLSLSGSGGGGRQRKSLDSPINMVPMIDLLMVTIAFLLITAVWTHTARLDAAAKVPGTNLGDACDLKPCEAEKELHVDMHGKATFVLTWRQRGVDVRAVDVPRETAQGADHLHYGELAKVVASEWRANGAHREINDGARDRAVLHTGNDARYDEIIAVMDAIHGTRRPARGGGVEAFAVTFSVQ
jgi:biopolymer transport protein ExbD